MSEDPEDLHLAITGLVREGRRKLEAAGGFVNNDASGHQALFARTPHGEIFVVRRLVPGRGIDDLAAWTVSHLDTLLRLLEQLDPYGETRLS